MSIDYDVIIIGTGPGVGTLAYRLAPSGKKILLLEWGDYLPREKDNWSSKTVFIDNKYKAKETWKDKDGGRFTPASTTTSVGFRRSTARPLRTNPESKSYPTTGRGCGYQTFHLPVGVMLNEEQKEQSACIRCSTCDGFPCLVNDKADSQVVCVDPELQYPNVTFF